MRITLLLAVGLVSAAVAVPVHAQTAAKKRTITLPETVVRSGPGEKSFPTSKLRKGDEVIVLGLSDKGQGWLEILPPTGSFSWIPERFVKREGKNVGYVCADPDVPVPIRPGSAVSAQKPDVEHWKLKRGDAVIILGEPFHTEGTSWLPIATNPGELRYIPAEAVQGSPATDVKINVAGAADATIQQADLALQQGSVTTAKSLYHLAVQQADKNHHYDSKVYCWRKLDQINKSAQVTAAAYQPGHPQYLTAQGSTAPVKFANQTTVNYAKTPGTSGVPGKADWSKWGRLARSNFYRNGQRMYALVDGQGKTLTYAVTPAHLTLENYVGRVVCLYGSNDYHSDVYLRANYMNVTYVALP